MKKVILTVLDSYVYANASFISKPFLLWTLGLAGRRGKFASGRKQVSSLSHITESKNMAKLFHQILKENFKDKNLSEVARQLNIPRSVLQDWIQEEREPSLKNIEYIRSIAGFLGLSLDELLGGESKTKIISSVMFEDEGKKYQVLINRIK